MATRKGSTDCPQAPVSGGAQQVARAKECKQYFPDGPGKLRRPLSQWGKEGGPVRYEAKQNIVKQLRKTNWRYDNDHGFVKRRFPRLDSPVEQVTILERLNRKRPLEDDSHIKVLCQGKHIKPLLDSGAARSIISKQVLDSLPGRNDLRNAHLKHFIAANKHHMKVLGVVTLTIYLGEDPCRVMFHVVEELATQMILGRDFLLKHKVKVDFKEKEITYDMPEALFSAYEVSIPPESEVSIEVKMNRNSTDCDYAAKVVPEYNNPMSPLLSRKKQLVRINRGKTVINVTNKSHEEIRVKAGTRLAIAMATNPYQGLNRKNNPQSNDKPGRPIRTDAEYRQVLDSLEFEGSVLTPEQQLRLKQTIWPQGKVLSVNGDIGCLKNYEHNIELNEEKVITAVPYRLSPVARQVMKEHLEDLERQGVICRYMSDYSSPCMLVRKPGYEGLPITQAKHRLVLDLRKINSIAQRQSYQIPHIAETLTQMQECKMKYVTVMDLTKGYCQIALSKQSLRYTGFKTDGLGSYAQCRLPQGFVNSGEIFQSIMEGLIPEEVKRYCYVYMDDLAILTETFEKHLEVLGKVLCTLKDNGLTVQIEKSKFCQREVKFLGYVIGEQGIKVRPEKCQAIMNVQRPKNVKQVRSFLGAVGWNRRFIKDFSLKARPLHDLTKKGVPFKWTTLCQKALMILSKL